MPRAGVEVVRVTTVCFQIILRLILNPSPKEKDFYWLVSLRRAERREFMTLSASERLQVPTLRRYHDESSGEPKA
jgi:hypothetical protein